MKQFIKRSLILILLSLFALTSKTHIQAEVNDTSLESNGFITQGGFEFIYSSDDTICIIGYKGEEKDLVIPDTINGIKVTELGEYAFESSDIETAQISDNIKHLPEGLFDSCYNLRAIILPAELESIGENAISNCENLYSIRIPKSVTFIDEDAFADMENLTIHCYQNSAAHKFAEDKHRVLFIGTYLKTTSATMYTSNTMSVPLINGDDNFKFSSSNKKVAKVSSDGKITALAKGTAKITAKNIEQTFTFKVTVKDMTINKKTASITLGSGVTLSVKGAEKITWKSSNTSIATVNKKGEVSAKKLGSATITAKVNNKTFTCKVTIKENAKNFPYTKNYKDFTPGTAYLVFSKAINDKKKDQFVVEGYVVNSSNKRLNKIDKVTIHVYCYGDDIAKKQFKNYAVNLKPYSSKKVTFKIDTKNNLFKNFDFRVEDVSVYFDNSSIKLK